MRALVSVCLLLASCAHKADDVTNSAPPEEPKAAIRERLVPGMTFGNVVLQRETIDAVKDAFVTEGEPLACSSEQLIVSDTWPLGEPAPSEYSAAFLRWTELWTLDACGSSVDVEVVYLLHSNSGIINVSVSKLREGQTLTLS